jgi:hypothetical protein
MMPSYMYVHRLNKNNHASVMLQRNMTYADKFNDNDTSRD